MATFTVSTNADGGAGSLRAAIAGANANPDADVIEFAEAVKNQTIRLQSELRITQGAVTIRGDQEGDGEVDITISGDVGVRHLTVDAGATASIVGVRLLGGMGQNASSIQNAGTLSIRDSSFIGNTATGAADSAAGTVVNAAGGALTIVDTLFSGNTATGGDGSFYTTNDGGVAAAGIVNSGTLSIERVGFQGTAYGGAGSNSVPYSIVKSGDGGAASVGIVSSGGAQTATASGYAAAGSAAVGGPGGTGGYNTMGMAGYAAVLTGYGASGGEGADTLTSRNGVALGFDGADVLTAEAAGAILAGHDENDTLTGGAGADTLLGGANDDLLTGGVGGDSLNGGFGDDMIVVVAGASGAVTVTGGAGEDALSFEAVDANLRFDLASTSAQAATGGLTVSVGGVENLLGGAGDDLLKGDAAANEIGGGRGGDRLVGRAGADDLRGGGGADVLRGGADDDSLRGNGGADTLNGGGGDDVSRGGARADVLRGGGGDDRLIGGGGGDRLIGGGGSDRLIGGGGDDVLAGGGGGDRLRGGAGEDQFVFTGAAGVDRVLDFQNGFDKIALRQLSGVDDLTIAQAGAATTIDHAGGRIVLRNTDASTIDEADFIF